jgi:hypothetical protein
MIKNLFPGMTIGILTSLVISFFTLSASAGHFETNGVTTSSVGIGSFCGCGKLGSVYSLDCDSTSASKIIVKKASCNSQALQGSKLVMLGDQIIQNEPDDWATPWSFCGCGKLGAVYRLDCDSPSGLKIIVKKASCNSQALQGSKLVMLGDQIIQNEPDDWATP